MLRELAILGLLVGMGHSSLLAQDPLPRARDWSGREDRVVLYSPHFDVPIPIPARGGLNCPSGPLHLFGFESPETAEEGAELRVRTMIYGPWSMEGIPPPAEGIEDADLLPVQAMVVLTHRIVEGAEEPLPLEPPWAQIADESGQVTLAVPPGVFRIHFSYLGVGKQEGVIQVRPSRSDSIWAVFLPGAICSRPALGAWATSIGLP